MDFGFCFGYKPMFDWICTCIFIPSYSSHAIYFAFISFQSSLFVQPVQHQTRTAKLLFARWSPVLGLKQKENEKCSFTYSKSKCANTIWKPLTITSYFVFENVLSVGHKFEIIQVYAQIIKTTLMINRPFYIYLFILGLSKKTLPQKIVIFFLPFDAIMKPTMYSIVCQYSTPPIHDR